MGRKGPCLVLCSLASLLGAAVSAHEITGRMTANLEAGAVFTGYNDVRIPGKGGTKLSLSEDLQSGKPPFWRARLSYRLGERHSLSVLVAPLTVEAHGMLQKEIVFRDVVFPAGTSLDATYRFDSYRLTYRYELMRREALRIGMGLTAKIRDAAISLVSADAEAEKPNTGFVPLVNVRLQWLMSDRFGLLVDGDALAAPQGRAEDLLFALRYAAIDRLALIAGYRFLEGGADNDEVYTFAMFHYLSVGAELSL